MLPLLAFAAAQAVQLPLEPGSIPLREFRTLPDAEFARRALGPLGLFPFVSHRERSPDRIALHPESVWFWTRPRPTDHPGVCASDRLIVQFRPTRVSGPDTGMQPTGVDLQTYYIIQDDAVARQTSGHPMDWGQRMASLCPEFDPRSDSTAADSAFQLVRARELVEQLGVAATAGRAPAPLDCSRMNWNGDPPADEAACLREMTWLRADSVDWVQNCWPRREAPGGCLQVLTSRWFIEFDQAVGGDPIRIVVNGIEDNSAVQ